MVTDIVQKQYDFEHQRRGELTSATNLPIVAVTVLSSASAVALLDFPYDGSTLTAAFAAVSVMTVALLFAAVYYILRSIWNHVYSKLAPAASLSGHLDELRAWHTSQGADAGRAASLAEIDFREYLNQQLSAAADWNGQTNDRRGNFLHMATTALAISLALFIPTALLYAYAKANAPEKVHRVEVFGLSAQPKERIVTTPANNGSPSTSPVPSTTPAQSMPSANPAIPIAKPIGPSNSQFRTNTELPSPQAGEITRKGGE